MSTADHQLLRRNPVAAMIFYSVCIVLFPVTLVGYVLWVATLYAGRRSGVSGTAQGPLSARWLQHRMGTRLDEPAYRLLTVLPTVSPLAVWLAFGPILLAHRLSTYVPRAFRYPFDGEISLQNQASARQTFYDGVVDRYLARVEQFVILGAGFDTRAFRLSEETQMRVRSFEVDAWKTMAIKREALQQAQVRPAAVAFVSADFETENWRNRLVDAGFKADRPALFLWEGVTPYLERAAIENTLRTIAGTATGGIVAFDYITTEVIESPAVSLKMVRASLRAGGEPLKFGLDSTPPASERVAELLRSCGLSLGEQHTVGQEGEGRRAWGGFVVAFVDDGVTIRVTSP